MKRVLILALMAVVANCRDHRAVNQDSRLEAEIGEIRASHPGIKEACLDGIRAGKFGAFEWMDNADCFEMLRPQRWSGLWNSGWEWTNFCPEPAKDCPISSERGDIWLTFAKGAFHGPEVSDGVYRIDFVGRRTKVPGYFGHQAQYDHLMVVDRMVSMSKRPEKTE